MKRGYVPMRHGLIDEREISRMVTLLCGSIGGTQRRAAEQRAVGCLHQVWSWVDLTTEDHIVHGGQEGTLEHIDGLVGWDGFAAAMRSVGWLFVRDDDVHFPDLAEWMGDTARKRAKEREKKARYRERQRVASTDVHRDVHPPVPDSNSGPCPPLSRAAARAEGRGKDSSSERGIEGGEAEPAGSDPPPVPQSNGKRVFVMPRDFVLTPELRRRCAAWVGAANDALIDRRFTDLMAWEFERAFSDPVLQLERWMRNTADWLRKNPSWAAQSVGNSETESLERDLRAAARFPDHFRGRVAELDRSGELPRLLSWLETQGDDRRRQLLGLIRDAVGGTEPEAIRVAP